MVIKFSLWINLMLSKFNSSMPFLVCEMMKRKQRLVRCCLCNKTIMKRTCYCISHCLKQWQIISQFLSRLNPKCRTTDYQCLSTPHLRSKICVYKVLTDTESKNHEVLFWQWFKNTISGINSLAKLTYSRVRTEQHWKRTESERNKLSKGLVKGKNGKDQKIK